MPIKKCSKNGKSGYKWGDEGKCYTGKDAKVRAAKQGIAIHGPDEFAKIMKADAGELTEEELLQALYDAGYNVGVQMLMVKEIFK